jgi:hypothetical protein
MRRLAGKLKVLKFEVMEWVKQQKRRRLGEITAVEVELKLLYSTK